MGVANISGNILTDSGASLSSYLPLTGGTLTGALNGTSATFSDLVTTTSVYRIVQASASRGGLYTYNQVAGSGTDYSLGIASEGEAFITTGGTSTKRLVVTSGGNVVIGNSSTTGKQLVVNQTGTSGYFLSGEASGTEIAYWYYNASEIQFSSKASTRALTFLTSDTERMRITSSGRVGIGQTSPGTALSVAGQSEQWQLALTTATGTAGAVIGSPSANVLAFGDWSGTERMRITSGGYVKASNNGTYYSSGGSYHEFLQSQSSNSCLRVFATSTAYDDAVLQTNCYRANNSAYAMAALYSNNFADIEFNLRGDGNGYADGSWTGGGADYAEYFEWLDGNPNNEDRRGYSVSLVGNKIKIAEKGETIIGVISGNPSVVGDSAWNIWTEKYLRDDFGTYVRDENGDRILNPNYNPDIDYIPREQRPEWGIVGLMGKLCIRKGQEVMPNWVKMKDVSDSVEQWLIK